MDINRYAYSLNDPINGSDAGGHYDDGFKSAGWIISDHFYNDPAGSFKITAYVAGAVVVTAVAPEVAAGIAARAPVATSLITDIAAGEVGIMAPTAASVAAAAKLSGAWTQVAERMSLEAAQYQLQNGGRFGFAVRVNGTNFDSVTNGGTLIESKGPGYLRLLDSASTGPGLVDRILGQATRQRKATNAPIEWRFAEKRVADFFGRLFSDNNLNINVRYVPHASSQAGASGAGSSTGGLFGGFFGRLFESAGSSGQAASCSSGQHDRGSC